MKPRESTRVSCLLLVVTAGYGSYCLAAGAGQGYGAFQASTPPGYEYSPEYPTELSEYTQRQEPGYPGSHSQWSEHGFYAAPQSWPSPAAPNQSFRFRDRPATPRVEPPMPRFRPDSLSGRSPYSWGREDGRWPEGSIGPAPVFRPLNKGSDKTGAVKKGQLRYSGGEFSNRGIGPGRTGYNSGSTGYRPLPGR